MKKKLLFIATLLSLFVLIFIPACDAEYDDSIKALTKPYINTYECVEARFGERDLLEKFEYIKLIFKENGELEVKFKEKDGERKTVSGTYSVDDKTGEFTADIGVMGYEFKESIIIENGEFTVTKLMFSKTLFFKFKAQ